MQDRGVSVAAPGIGFERRERRYTVVEMRAVCWSTGPWDICGRGLGSDRRDRLGPSADPV